MNWTHDAIADFGRRIGLEGWAVNSHGVAQLQLQSGAVLAVEPVADEVLVYMVEDAPYTSPSQWLDALTR